MTQNSQTTYGHLLCLHFILAQWIRWSTQDLLISINTCPKPKTSLKNKITKPRSAWPGISKLPIWSKANLISSPFLLDITITIQSATEDLRILWWAFGGSALLQSFPMDEWTLINKLPYLSAFNFKMVLEKLFNRLISPECCSQAGGEFITSSGKRSKSKELVPMAILITNGVAEGSHRMVTIFCHSDQAKVEP